MVRSYHALGRNVIGTWRTLLAELAETMTQVMRRTRSRAQGWTQNQTARLPGRRGYLQSLRGLGLIGNPVEVLESRLLLSALPYDLIATTTYMDATGHYRASGYSTHLTWQESSSPDSFTIQRQISGGNWVQLASLSNLSPSADGTFGWDDTNVAPATTYTYRVANLTTPVTYSNADVVRTLRGGDAQGDGIINASDFAQLDASYLKHIYNGGVGDPTPTWLQGDFNHDNVVDGSDFAICYAAFQNQQGAVANPWLVQASVQGPPNINVNLTWYDGASSITVYRSDGSMNADGTTHFVPIATGIPNTGSYTDTTVAANSTYLYVLMASDGTAQSGYSAKVRAILYNHAPVGTNGSITTRVNTAYTLGSSDFGFSDVDGNSLFAVKITSLPNNGNLYLNGAAITNAGQSISVIDLNSGGLQFLPATDQSGWPYDEHMTFQVQDNGGTASGGSDLDATPRTLTINVTPIQDAAVDAAVRSALQIAPGGRLITNDLGRLTSLTLDSSAVHSLAGLNYATTLQSLYMKPSDLSITGDLSSLAPLQNLTQLKTLVLQDAGLTDTELSGLGSHATLEELDVSYNQLTMAPSVAGLQGLNDLHLYGNATIMADLTDGNGAYPSLNNLHGKLLNLDLASDNPDAATSVQDLANRLYELPIRMYEWVLNHIDYQPYAGSMKGTLAVLQTQAGNDWDTANLLKQLLGEAGITSVQFDAGKISVSAQQAVSYFGAKDLYGAGLIALQEGLRQITYGALEFDHAWLKAQINGTNYYLDASWKFHDYQVGHTDLIDPANTTWFNQNAYLSDVSTETGVEYFEQQTQNYLLANYPNLAVNDIPHAGPIHPQAIVTLPATLPYTLVTDSLSTGIPDAALHKLQISVLNAAGTATMFTWAGNVSDMSLQRLSLCPVTSGANVIPTLYLNGTAVAASSLSFGSSDNIQIRVTHIIPGGTSGVYSYSRPAGKYIAIGINANQTSAQYLAALRGQVNDQMIARVNTETIANKEAFYGGLMQLAAMSYFSEATAGKERIAALVGEQIYYNRVESALTTCEEALQPPNLDLPFPFLPRTMGIDVRNMSAVTVPIQYNATESARRTAIVQWIGLHASSMESAVWEGLTNSEGVSTVKLLQLAASPGGGGTVTITAAEAQQHTGYADAYGYVQSKLPGVRAAISNTISDKLTSGYYALITAAKNEITVGNARTPPEQVWSGEGYFGQRPDSDGDGVPDGFDPIIHGGAGGVLESPHGGASNLVSQWEIPPADNSWKQTIVGDPVNVATGSVLHDETDFSLPNLGVPLEFTRSYNSTNTGPNPNQQDVGMGAGWSYSNSDRLLPSNDPNDPLGTMVWYTDTGDQLKFTTKSQNVTGTVTVRVDDPFGTRAPVACLDNIVVQYSGDGQYVSFVGTSNVLANDYDVDGHSRLTAQLVTGPQHAGAFTLNSNGTFTYQIDLSKLLYDPSGYIDQFTYRAVDGAKQSNTCTVYIQASSTSPTKLNPIQYLQTTPTTGHDGQASFDVDSSGLPITNTYYQSVTTVDGVVGVNFGSGVTANVSYVRYYPANGQGSTLNSGRFRYSDNGSSFTTFYTVGSAANGWNMVNYATGSHAWFAFSQHAVVTQIADMTFFGTTSGLNRTALPMWDMAGTRVNTPVVISPLANDVDIDGTLTLGQLRTTGWAGTASTSGTVVRNGDTVTYTPPANAIPAAGADYFTDRFQYQLTGQSGWVDVIVAVYNDLPPVAKNDGFVTASNNSITGGNFGANDLDPNTSPRTLTYSLVSGPSDAATGMFTFRNNGTFDYTAKTGWDGYDEFIYLVSDGSYSSQAKAVIVSPANASAATAAVALDDVIYTVKSGSPIQIDIPVLANDLDRDGNGVSNLVLRDWDKSSAYGKDITQSGGHLYYTPPANFSGTDVFQYTVANPDTTGGWINPQGLYGTLAKVGSNYKWNDLDGNIVTFDVTTGYLISKVDRYGNGVTITYDTVQNRILVQDATNTTRGMTITYDGTTKHITTVSDGTGRTWSYGYTNTTSTGQLNLVTPPTDANTASGTSAYTYYTDNARVGLLKTVKNAENPDDRVTTYEYYANRHGFRVTDALGASQSYAYNPYRDQTDYINELGQVTEYDYNQDGNLLAQRQPDGSTTRYEWDHGLRTAAYDEFGQKTTYLYNDPNGDGNLADSNGKLTSVTGPKLNASDLTGHRVSYGYVNGTLNGVSFINLDHVTDEGDPNVTTDSRTTQYTYDSAGRLTDVIDAALGDTRYTYNGAMGARGLPDSMTLPEGVLTSAILDDYKTTYVYNAAGQMIQQTAHVATGLSLTTNLEYDYGNNNRGLLTKSTDGRGLATSYTYDLLGRTLTQTQPDPDGVGGPLVAPVTKYTYNKVGQPLTSQLWQAGGAAALLSTSYVYDQMQRLLRTIQTDGSITSAYYNTLGEAVISADELGRITSHELNLLGQVVETILPDGAVLRTDYSAAGRVAAQYDALGNATTYVYDKLGRVVRQISADPDGGGDLPSLVTKTQYDAFGNVQFVCVTNTSEDLAVNSSIRATEYRYDLLNRKTFAATPDPDGAGSLLRMVTLWGYDHNGNVKQTAVGPEVITTLGDVKYTTVSTYDEIGRKISVTSIDPDDTTGPLLSIVTLYGYDGDNNVTQVTTAPASLGITLGNQNYTTDYTFDNLNRQMTQTSPDPDAIGSGAARPLTSYTYDQVGHLQTVTNSLLFNTTYAYDKRGHQVAVTTPDPDGSGVLQPMTTRTVYDLVGNVVETIDAMGTVTDSSYDVRNRLIEQRQPAPRNGDATRPSTIYVYDAAGNLLSTTDPRGATTRYVYDYLNRRTKVTDASGSIAGDSYHTTTTHYDAMGRIASVTDPLGRVTSYQYDNLGRKTVESLPVHDSSTPTIHYYYDSADGYTSYGNLVKQTDALNHSTWYQYDYLNRATYALDALSGGSLLVAGHYTQTTYDMMGRVAADFDQLGRKTAYEYDFLGRKTKLKQDDPYSTGTLVTNYQYDAAGNLLQETDPLNHSTWHVYDALNREYCTVDALGSGPTDLAHAVITTFDQAGNVVSIRDAANNTTRYTYDRLNRKLTETDALNRTISFTYDLSGLMTTRTDPLDPVTTLDPVTAFVYDKLSRKIQEKWYASTAAYANGTGTPTRTTLWHYDVVSQLYAVEDQDSSTYDSYDTAGNLHQETTLSRDQTQPAWTTSYVTPVQTTSFEFNLTGVPAGTRLMPTVTCLGVDVELLVLSPYRVSGNAGGVQTSTDEQGIGGTESTTLVADETGTWKFIVLVRGTGTAQLTVRNQTPTTLSTLTYTYNDAGMVTQIDDSAVLLPASQWGSTAYAYDTLERVQSITQTIGGTNTRSASYTYYDDNQVHTVQRYNGAVGVNPVATSTYTYDSEIGRLTGLVHTNATGSTLAQYDYTYDAAGQMTTFAILGDGSSTLGYDATNQLTSASLTGESYTYDANGNRTTVGGQSVTTTTDNQLSDDGTFTYTYDATGARLTRTRNSTAAANDYRTEYTWDQRHRLTAVTTWSNGSGGTTEVAITSTAQYTYDAQDRRIKTVIDSDGTGTGTPVTTYAIYQGSEVILELQDADLNAPPPAAATHRYFWGAGSDELLMDRDPAGVSTGDHWTLSDHEQSIRDVVDNTGVKQEHRKYDSFGNIVALTDGNGNTKSLSAMLTAYTYSGQRYDVITGLLNYHARYYDAKTGEFLSQDPSGFTGGDYNLYRYVGNNPLLYGDPTGLCRSAITSGTSNYNTSALSSLYASLGVPAGLSNNYSAIASSSSSTQNWLSGNSAGYADASSLANSWAYDVPAMAPVSSSSYYASAPASVTSLYDQPAAYSSTYANSYVPALNSRLPTLDDGTFHGMETPFGINPDGHSFAFLYAASAYERFSFGVYGLVQAVAHPVQTWDNFQEAKAVVAARELEDGGSSARAYLVSTGYGANKAVGTQKIAESLPFIGGVQIDNLREFDSTSDRVAHGFSGLSQTAGTFAFVAGPGASSFSSLGKSASGLIEATRLTPPNLTMPGPSAYVIQNQLIRGAVSPAAKAVGNDLIQFLGKNARVITNPAGDTVILSNNGLKRVRFDFNNPSTHANPHSHVEIKVNGKWVKSGPLYPSDVTPK